MKRELSLPAIDYARHPAFQGLDVRCTLDEEVTGSLAAAIDVAYGELSAAGQAQAHEVEKEFAARISPRIAQLEAYVMTADLPPALRTMTQRAMVEAGRFLLQQAVFLRCRRWEVPDCPVLSDTLKGNLKDLRQEGYVRCAVNGPLAASVWRRTWWERSMLRARAGTSPGRHCAMPLDPHSPAVAAIREALHSEGILAVASAYMECEMEWLYAALDFSHPNQSWYKGCYADVGLPTSKTVYMHFDADTDIIKAMLYLSDVDAAAGPFRFVRGSHRWRRSPFLFALHKGFDLEQTKCFEMEPDGLDYKLGYYRPRFHLIESRRDLLTLPSAFRGTTHFGDDIVDGTDLSSQLLASEEVFTGKAGTMIVFDGSAGIHRGSQVEKGERWAVQIAMRAVASGGGSSASMLKGLKARLRYQLFRSKNVITRLLPV